MSGMDLVEFLTARLDEREEAAREAVPRRWFSTDNYLDDVNDGTVARFEIKADARHAALYDPAYVLAEVAAKRQIIARVAEDGMMAWDPRKAQAASTQEWYLIAACRDTLKFLALPDADHPDYREEWRP